MGIPIPGKDGLYIETGPCNPFLSSHGSLQHYNDIIMGTIASQLTSLTIVYSTVYSDADQRKHQSSTSLAFVRGIHWGPVNSPHKWPVMGKMFPLDDVIMNIFQRAWAQQRSNWDQNLYIWNTPHISTLSVGFVSVMSIVRSWGENRWCYNETRRH